MECTPKNYFWTTACSYFDDNNNKNTSNTNDSNTSSSLENHCSKSILACTWSVMVAITNNGHA